MTFFAIVGIVVCALTVFFLLAIFFFIWRLRRSLREMVDTMGTAMPLATPARIHLHRREKITWLDPEGEEKANQLLQALWRLGFQDAGSYEISEMFGLKVRALARPEENLWGVVYQHPQAGVWMDIVTRYADGGSLTTSNTEHGRELQHLPGHDKIYAPELDGEGLYRRHLAARRQDVEFRPVAPENFQIEFEKAYADEMDWRLSRGGVTEEELRAIAAQSGKELSNEEFEALRQTHEAQSSMALTDAIRDHFLEDSPLSAAEWEKLRGRMVIIHDRMLPEFVAGEFQSWSFGDDDAPFAEDEDENESAAPSYPEGLTPRRGFEHLNSTLPAARRFEKIAELSEPVPADVYRAAPTAVSPCED